MIYTLYVFKVWVKYLLVGGMVRAQVTDIHLLAFGTNAVGDVVKCANLQV